MALDSKNKIKTNDYTELEKQFNCVKCSIRLKDVKLLKLHFWKVHINKNENLNDMKLTDTVKIGKKLETNHDVLEKSRKRKISINSEDSISVKRRNGRRSQKIENKSFGDLSASNTVNDIDNSMNTSLDNVIEYGKQLEKINKLTKHEIRAFNMCDLEENEIMKRVKSLKLKKNVSFKGTDHEFKQGEIVWTKWKTNLMWPALVEKLIKNKSNKIKRVHIRYFELNDLKSPMFKMDPLRIKPFFESEEHFHYKEIGAEAKGYEFFATYSKAVKEFSDSLENQEEIILSKNHENSEDSGISVTKYSVNDQMLTVEQITEHAKAPFSDRQIEINKRRENYSQNLIDVLKTAEFEDFIKSILENTVKCKRHTAYIKGTPLERKDMRFCSPGPLIPEHQKVIAEILINLSTTYYPDKASHLKTYEYDVLYPEALIWAIRKLDKTTQRKAESKYKLGIEQTNEESMKQRCNEILLKISEENSRLACSHDASTLELDSLNNSKVCTIFNDEDPGVDLENVSLDESVSFVMSTMLDMIDRINEL